MAFTSAQLAALEAAIATGALSVGHGDKKVTHHSLAEMLALRDRMIRELSLSTRPRRTYGSYDRDTSGAAETDE